MFRKLIFALMLVVAAFAGGAAINGPGLAWLQRTFAGGPSIIVDDSQPTTPKPPKPFPTAKPKSIEADLKRLEVSSRKPAKPTSPPIEDPMPQPATPPAVGLLQVADPSTVPVDEPAKLAARAPSPALDPMPPLGLPLDPVASPAPPKFDPVARLASTSTPGPSKDWAEIRKRMKDQGIARYSIDAEVDGRVKFSCVIPVDGLRAVGHHFEAEGDDEIQAVEAALKRIALWRATESK